jgi:hypothetical protein
MRPRQIFVKYVSSVRRVFHISSWPGQKFSNQNKTLLSVGDIVCSIVSMPSANRSTENRSNSPGM